MLKQSGADDVVKNEGSSSHTIDSDMMTTEKLNKKKENDEMEKEMKKKKEEGEVKGEKDNDEERL